MPPKLAPGYSGVIGEIVDVTDTNGEPARAVMPSMILAAPNGLPAGSSTNPIVTTGPTDYETVAAGQTAQVLGTAGAAGDYLDHLLIVPATTSPGAVTILDNATSITVFAGGASSVSTLIPFAVPIGAKSVSGAWKVTTGANVSVVAVGEFS